MLDAKAPAIGGKYGEVPTENLSDEEHKVTGGRLTSRTTKVTLGYCLSTQKLYSRPKNLVFHLNSYRDKSLALELKIAFDCKVITVTHFSEWSSVIHDNLEKKLRIILRKKETNELEDLIQKSFEEEREVVLAVVMRFIVMRSVILLLWINHFIPFRRRDAYCMWVPVYV